MVGLPTPFYNKERDSLPLAINKWEDNHEEPISNFTIDNPTKMQRTASGRQYLPRVPEVLVYDNPADYIRSTNFTDNYYSQPTTMLHSQRPRHNSSRLSLSPNQNSFFGNMPPLSQSPGTPTTDELTNAPTFTSGMSRQSSHVSGSLCGGVDMMNLHSQQSNSSDWSLIGESSPLNIQHSLDFPNDSSTSLSISSPLFESPNSINSHPYQISPMPSFTATAVPPCSTTVEHDQMKRSSSSESNASSQSRHFRRRQEQIAQGSRPIAPKISDEVTEMSRQSSSDQRMIRIKSADGSIQEKMPISKTIHSRPAHEKLKCTKCNEKPDGFRGPHELQRHTDRAHRMLRKAWVCVDVSRNKDFLSNCKACRQNKKYGAYYNAAAHLRRTHFNKRYKGRKGKAKLDEKRGGKGGGEYPSMDVLKIWMQETEEWVPENMAIDDVEDETLDSATIDHFFGDVSETSTQPFPTEFDDRTFPHACHASNQTFPATIAPSSSQITVTATGNNPLSIQNTPSKHSNSSAEQIEPLIFTNSSELTNVSLDTALYNTTSDLLMFDLDMSSSEDPHSYSGFDMSNFP